jgi:trimeric autotransporter adhesin
LTATAATGWTFDRWEGDLTGTTNPATITMDADKTVTAVFTQNRYTLTVTTTGNGTVAKAPDQAEYLHGTEVTLTATPSSGWVFDRWEGDLTGSTNPASILMEGNRSVNAVFVEIENILTLNTEGSGTVTANPSQGTYTSGTEVTLTATAATGWTFDRWEGDLTGSSNPATITMDADKTVTAVFTQNQYTLTVTTTGNGTVAKAPDQAEYLHGTEVTLTATPSSGWVFDRWEGRPDRQHQSGLITDGGQQIRQCGICRNRKHTDP